MLLGVLATNEYRILGEVGEGPEAVHVLVRTTPYTTGTTTSHVEVLSLARTPDGWKIQEAPAIDALLVALGSFGR